MELFIIAVILGLIPACIASSKGRSFFWWWVYGFFLFIVALIHSIVISKNHSVLDDRQLGNGMRKCPFCAELVKQEAIKCKHCGSSIEREESSSMSSTDDTDKTKKPQWFG